MAHVADVKHSAARTPSDGPRRGEETSADTGSALLADQSVLPVVALG